MIDTPVNYSLEDVNSTTNDFYNFQEFMTVSVCLSRNHYRKCQSFCESCLRKDFKNYRAHFTLQGLHHHPYSLFSSFWSTVSRLSWQQVIIFILFLDIFIWKLFSVCMDYLGFFYLTKVRDFLLSGNCCEFKIYFLGNYNWKIYYTTKKAIFPKN